MFPAMSMGGTPPQLVDQVRTASTDLTITLPGYTAGRFPIMEVFELPFMTNSAEVGARAAWDFHHKYAPKEFAGTKLLAMWVHDEGYVHTRDRPVKTLADFKGLKMRAPTRQTNKLLDVARRLAGRHAAAGDADAVSKGTIDGFLLPWEVMPSLKLQEMVKFHSETDPSRPALYSVGVHLRHEPGQVRRLAGRPEEGDRQQQRRRAVAADRQDLGREPGRRAARPRTTAATPST